MRPAPPDLPPPRLTALFRGPIELNVTELAAALQGLHPELAEMTLTLDTDALARGAPLGDAAWGPHSVRLAGFALPLPTDRVEACVRPAHWPPAFKDAARRHTSHLILTYAGAATEPLERLVALTAVAAALAPQGAWALLHEDARSCFPADLLWDELTAGADPDASPLDVLRSLPLPLFYGGFVKYEIAGEPGVWMRTYGLHRLGLPDLAYRAAGHHQGQETFELFSGLLDYLRESGTAFAPGHTMQVGPDRYLGLREPAAAEYYLDNPGLLLVAERIGPDEINRP
jgi:Domain of unknown function (DUF4261)